MLLSERKITLWWSVFVQVHQARPDHQEIRASRERQERTGGTAAKERTASAEDPAGASIAPRRVSAPATGTSASIISVLYSYLSLANNSLSFIVFHKQVIRQRSVQKNIIRRGQKKRAGRKGENCLLEIRRERGRSIVPSIGLSRQLAFPWRDFTTLTQTHA